MTTPKKKTSKAKADGGTTKRVIRTAQTYSRDKTNDYDDAINASHGIADQMQQEAWERSQRIYEHYLRDQQVFLPLKKQPAATTGLTEQVALIGGQVIYAHKEDGCRGYWCCIHNMSPHHMRRWIQEWDADTKQMYRLCVHKKRHPDPDDTGTARHDPKKCCGCCDRKAVSRPVQKPARTQHNKSVL